MRPAIPAVAVLAAVLLASIPFSPSGRSHAQAVATITLPPPGTSKALYEGCNNITLTFPDATPVAAVAQAVEPSATLQAVWRHDAAQKRFQGFSPTAPAASDLLAVNFLDAVWLCVAPVLPSAPSPTDTPSPTGPLPTPTPSPTSTPTSASVSTPTATPAYEPPTDIVVPPDYLDTFRYSTETAFKEEPPVRLTSTGSFQAPDRISCTVGISVAGFVFDAQQLIVIGDDAWIHTGEGWTTASATDEEVVSSLGLCPGSNLFWEGFGADIDLSVLVGHPETKNGVPAFRYSPTGSVHIPGLLLLGDPADTGGITIQSYDLWLAQNGGWVVALDINMTADAASDGDSGTEALPVTMRVDITQPNSPNIRVEPPGP